MSEYIDVDYEETEKKDKGDKNINIALDPTSASIQGACGVINNITNSIKEYNMCRQQEQTKRANIKAQMKVAIEQINAQKELYLKQLENEHEKTMYHIAEFYKKSGLQLEILNKAIDKCIENGDNDLLLSLLNLQNDVIESRNKEQLEMMDKTSEKVNTQINCNNVSGYIE